METILYKWRGEDDYTLKQISAIHHKESGDLLSSDALRSRIKRANGDVAKALINKKLNVKLNKIMCPDGIKRTRRQMAEYHNMSYAGFMTRVHSRGSIEAAWEVGENLDIQGYSKNKTGKVKVRSGKRRGMKKPSIDLQEAARVQKALDAIPSPTKYEVELWG